MQRLTARLLLVLLLAGIFVPAALAISAEPPHACCMRKMHGSKAPQLQGVSHRHDCCGPLATAKWAQTRDVTSAHVEPGVVKLHVDSRPAHPYSDFTRDHSGRGPPR